MDLVQESKRFRNRIAIASMFFVLGIDFASWASRIPAIKEHLKMDDATLGAVLLSSPVGSLLTLPLAGWLVTKFGSKIMTLIAGILYSVTLPLLGYGNEIWHLAVALFLFGIGGEILNISVNTQAVELEKIYNKPIMSSFHGFFSLGGMVGAGLSAFIIQFHIDPFQHFLIIMVLGILATLFFSGRLLPFDSTSNSSHPLFVRPSGVLIGLGIIAFCCMLGEGAMSDWSSEYYKQTFKTDSGLNTLAYAGFSLAMAFGRFNGDWLTAKLGTIKTLQLSGLISGAGLLIALIIVNPIITIVGFACVGLGYATVVPLVYSAAGKSKIMSPGVALAAVSTLGYLGFLFGPPIIGFIAQGFSLRIALGLVVLLSFMIIFLSNQAGEKKD